MSQRKTQGFNGWQCGGGDSDDLKPAVMDRLMALAQQAIDAGMVPFLGFGFVHYIDGKPQDHGKGREREVGRVFARACARLRGPYAVYCNGLDDHIEPGRVTECAAGFRETNRTAPLGFHPLHGVWARPPDDMGPIFATTQSGHRNLSRAHSQRLVIACNPTRYAVFAQEPCYEGAPQYGNASHIINAADVREAIGGAVDGGAAGVGYGHTTVWAFGNGWKKAITSAGAYIPAQEAKRI